MIGNVEVCFEVKRGWHSNGQGGGSRCVFEEVCLSVVDCAGDAICKDWLGDCGVRESCEISVVSGFDRRQSLGWRLASLMKRL